MLAMELEDIEREKFDGSLAKRQIRQYFPPSINCAIRYLPLTHRGLLEILGCWVGRHVDISTLPSSYNYE